MLISPEHCNAHRLTIIDPFVPWGRRRGGSRPAPTRPYGALSHLPDDFNARCGYNRGIPAAIIAIFNVADLALHRQFVGHTDQLRAVGLTPDGRYGTNRSCTMPRTPSACAINSTTSRRAPASCAKSSSSVSMRSTGQSSNFRSHSS